MNQRHVDNLNLAYVAFTRPRYNLFLWANTKGKKTNHSVLSFLILHLFISL